MSPEERRRRQAEYRKKKAEEAGREYKAIPTRRRKESGTQYTYIKPKQVTDMSGHQTVEEWIKAGGVIDRSPTVPKFERLTADEIESAPYRQKISASTISTRSYLSG